MASAGDLVIRILTDNRQYLSGINEAIRHTLSLSGTVSKEVVGAFRASERAAQQAADALTRHNYVVNEYLESVKRYAFEAAKGLLSLEGVKRFSDFNKAMTEATSVMTGLTQETTKQLEDLAKTLAITTKFSATKAAEAFYHLATAGFNVNDILRIMPRVAEFATAGNFDLAKSADIVGVTLSALRLKSASAEEKLQNVVTVTEGLTRVANKAQGSIGDFGLAITRDAAAAAAQFQIPLKEVIAVLGVYHEQGLRGAIAGNTFGRMIRLLTSSLRKHEQVWKDMGVEVFEKSGPRKGFFRPLNELTADLEKALEKYHPKGRGDFLDALGMKTLQQKSETPLLGMSKMITEYMKIQEEAGNVVQEVAEKQMTAFANAMQVVKNTISVARIELEQMFAPAFLKVGEMVLQAIAYWQSLGNETQKTILALAGMTLGLMAVSSSVTYLLPLVKVLTLYSAPFVTLALALTTLSQTDMGQLRESFGEVVEAAKVLWEAIKEVAEILLSILVPAIKEVLLFTAQVIQAFATFVKENKELVKNVLLLVVAFKAASIIVGTVTFVIKGAVAAYYALRAAIWATTHAMLANPLTAAATAATIGIAFLTFKLMKARNEMTLTDAVFRKATDGIRESLDQLNQGFNLDAAAKLSSNIAALGKKAGEDYRKPIEDAIKKVEAALRNSVEAMARIQDYRDMVLGFNRRKPGTSWQDAAFPNLYDDTSGGRGQLGDPRMPTRVPMPGSDTAAPGGRGLPSSTGAAFTWLSQTLPETLDNLARAGKRVWNAPQQPPPPESWQEEQARKKGELTRTSGVGDEEIKADLFIQLLKDSNKEFREGWDGLGEIFKQGLRDAFKVGRF